MIVNLDKFQAMALESFGHCLEPDELVLGKTIMKTSYHVKVRDTA